MKSKLILHRLLVTLTIIFGAVSVLGLLRRFHWSGDLAALVTDYLFGALLLLLIGFGLTRRWRWVAIAAILLLMNGVTLLNYDSIAPISSGDSATGDRTVGDQTALRVMVYNIYHRNPDLESVIAEVRKYDPDLLFLMEYSNAIQTRIESEFEDYPHQLIRTSRQTMGLALFSRIPFDDTEIHRFQATRIPIFQAVMTIDDTPFTFVGGHSWPPQPRWGQLHRDQVGSITSVASQSIHPLIVAGDFNASQWSFAVQDLSRQAGVANILRPFDLTKTSSPVPLIGLPIDHVLLSDEWVVTAVQYGAAGGSDHKPIVVDLRLE